MSYKNIIKISKYLSTVKEASTSDILQNTNISQPEVSVTISEMYALGLIVKIRVPRPRGRPKIVCKLTKNIEEIEEYIKNELYNECLKE